MYKVKYGLVGALIGVIFGGVVYCGQELWAYISCNEVNTETTLKVFGIGVTIGLIIGIIVGAFADKEAKRAAIEAKRQAEEDARIAMQEERERQRQAAIQAEEYILKKWSEARLLPVLKAFDTIESIIDVDDNGNIIYAQPFYDQHNANNCRRRLEEIQAEAIQKDRSAQYVSYSKHFQTELNNAITSLNELIQATINDYKKFKFDFRASLSDGLCQLAYLTGDNGYLTAANIFDCNA